MCLVSLRRISRTCADIKSGSTYWLSKENLIAAKELAAHWATSSIQTPPSAPWFISKSCVSNIWEYRTWAGWAPHSASSILALNLHTYSSHYAVFLKAAVRSFCIHQQKPRGLHFALTRLHFCIKCHDFHICFTRTKILCIPLRYLVDIVPEVFFLCKKRLLRCFYSATLGDLPPSKWRAFIAEQLHPNTSCALLIPQSDTSWPAQTTCL